MAYVPVSTFSRGVLRPELRERQDLELYRAGLVECENWTTLETGGIRRRGGTKYVGQIKDMTAGAWYIDFEFSDGQSYMLEFGELYFRVWTSNGRIGTVEVVTPYTLAEARDIKYVQSADVLFLVHPNHAPREIRRLSETNWQILELNLEDGPFLDINTTATTLAPAGRGSVTPVMTSNTTPEGVAADSAGQTTAYAAFDGTTLPAGDQNSKQGWVSYTFPGGTTKTADAYWLRGEARAQFAAQTPSVWKIQGYNGSTWITLDSQDAQGGWRAAEVRFFEFVNETAFEAYRIQFEANEDTATNGTAFAELGIHQKAEEQEPFSLTASSTVGINDDQGFLPTDVGRHIRLRGSDGQWRWLKIDAVETTTRVAVRSYGHSLPDTEPVTNWRLGAWSDTTGWPSSIGFYKNRLAFANTKTQPQVVWESEADDFESFKVSSPLLASDAVQIEIRSGKVNAIQWLADGEDLTAGTSSTIRLIGKDISGEAFGPDNVNQRPATNFGSKAIQPLTIGSTLMYWGRFGTDLREMIYNFDVNGFISRTLSIMSDHLYQDGIEGGSYQQYPSSIIWQWNIPGDLIGFTYEREQEVYGFHTHTFENGVVECVRTLTTATYDEVWLLMRRTINGQTVRYHEVMQVPFENQELEDAWHLDSALLYDGPPANTFSNLDHLEGESVIIYGDGTDYEATVSGGSVSLADGRTASKALIGKNVTARAKMLSPAMNAQDGSSTGRRMQVNDARIKVLETASLWVGSDEGEIDDAVLSVRKASEDPDFNPLYSGWLKVPVDMRWSEGAQLVLMAQGGRPSTVVAVNSNVKMEP